MHIRHHIIANITTQIKLFLSDTTRITPRVHINDTTFTAETSITYANNTESPTPTKAGVKKHPHVRLAQQSTQHTCTRTELF